MWELSAHEQLRALLLPDVPAVVLGIVITTAALAVLAIYTLRAKNRAVQLLSFGLVALLYGVRLLLKTPSVQLLFDAPQFDWGLVESTIGNFIVIPLVLFMEQIYGKGWRSSLRWLLWFFTAYAALATALEFLAANPHAAPDAGGILLIGLALVQTVGYFAGYRLPSIAYGRVLFLGLLVFLIAVLNEHLTYSVGWFWQFRFEPLGFFVLICTMGYIAVRQTIDNEQDLRALEEEMRSARRIQASILPASVPHLEGAEIAVRYLPMTAVAGDFYEFLPVSSRRIGIALADVAGHGVPAALVASMVKVAIDSQSASACDPPTLIAGLNNIMCRQARGKLITAAYLFLDLDARRACYAAAAHPPLLLRHRGRQESTGFSENGLILGVRPGETYHPMTFDLCAGDRILLYTDGIPEASNGRDRMFSEERFAEVFSDHDKLDAGAFADRLLEEVRAWAGSEQADDMTLMVIDIG
jgi:sigma-B regulation protein RsbU (phosphoserine phosphatase)